MPISTAASSEAAGPELEAGSTAAGCTGACDSRPLVVIDPGHGGIDNGASAPNGVHEKDIVLAFALDLQDVLVASGRFDVALTREDDTYLTLDERVDAGAAEQGGPVHLAARRQLPAARDPRRQHLYARRAGDRHARQGAGRQREQAPTSSPASCCPRCKPAVVDILVDLMRRQMRQQSYLAAEDNRHKPCSRSVALRRFPVRQADFFVLQAPDVPSMLVELGFLNNAKDIANLQKTGLARPRGRCAGARASTPISTDSTAGGRPAAVTIAATIGDRRRLSTRGASASCPHFRPSLV